MRLLNHTPWARRLTALTLLTTTLGCTELMREEGRFPDQDQGLAAVADGGVLQISDGGVLTNLVDAEGQWALFVEERRCFSALGARNENVVWSWYLTDIEVEPSPANPSRLRLHPRLCRQTLTPLIGALQTFVPDRLLDRLPVPAIAAFQFGQAPGSPLLAEEILQIWGADIGRDDPLPDGPDDPVLVDLDEDGEPGVTFLVGTDAQIACEVRVAQRTRLTLSGAVENAIKAAGTVESSLEQVVLDSTTSLCAAEAEFAVSPTPSRFVLLRIDGRDGALDLDLDGSDAVECDELLEALPALENDALQRIEPQDGVCR